MIVKILIMLGFSCYCILVIYSRQWSPLSNWLDRDPVGGKEEEVLETENIPRYCEHCGSDRHYTSEH